MRICGACYLHYIADKPRPSRSRFCAGLPRRLHPRLRRLVMPAPQMQIQHVQASSRQSDLSLRSSPREGYTPPDILTNTICALPVRIAVYLQAEECWLCCSREAAGKTQRNATMTHRESCYRLSSRRHWQTLVWQLTGW